MTGPEPPTNAPISIFGTDGVRDRPGEGYLADDALGGIAAAIASALERREAFGAEFPRGGDRIVLGRDTRESGERIAASLTAAFRSFGLTVVDVGVLPTPGVAWIASRREGSCLGVVISASHNPAEYNGIKLFAPGGAKVSPAFEQAISERFWARTEPSPASSRGAVVEAADEAREEYIRALVTTCREPDRLRGLGIALDGANGATWQVAPEVFRRLGLRVHAIACEPDGRNINAGCGALHPERLSATVRESGARFGFSFDGDGDRVVPVAAGGGVLDGDNVLLLAGRKYSREGRLPLGTIVATVMSNLGLEIALRESGLTLERTDVGDRNVYLAMVRGGHPVGGEQSGHLLFLDRAMTGDGVLAAVRCLDMLDDDLDLERDTRDLRRYPQILRNVPVGTKPPIESLPGVASAVREAVGVLGDQGRVLLRYSGTEPVLRVMIEGPDQALIEGLAADICGAVRASLGDRDRDRSGARPLDPSVAR